MEIQVGVITLLIGAAVWAIGGSRPTFRFLLAAIAVFLLAAIANRYVFP